MPNIIRCCVVHVLGEIQAGWKTPSHLITAIPKAFSSSRCTGVVDLGSGSGTVAIKMIQEIRTASHLPITLTLTDKYPSCLISGLRIVTEQTDWVRVIDYPIDFRGFQFEGSSFYLFRNSLHHISNARIERIVGDLLESKSIFSVIEPYSYGLHSAVRVLIEIPTSFEKCLRWYRENSFSSAVALLLSTICAFILFWDGVVSVIRSRSTLKIVFDAISKKLGSNGYSIESSDYILTGELLVFESRGRTSWRAK